MEYTMGEWKARKLYDKRLDSAYAIEVIAPSYDVDIALIQQYDIEPTEVISNAHLIAAAPDMYEALKYAEAFCEAVGQGLVAVATRDMVEDVIKEALAKAERRM